MFLLIFFFVFFFCFIFINNFLFYIHFESYYFYFSILILILKSKLIIFFPFVSLIKEKKKEKKDEKFHLKKIKFIFAHVLRSTLFLVFLSSFCFIQVWNLEFIIISRNNFKYSNLSILFSTFFKTEAFMSLYLLIFLHLALAS